MSARSLISLYLLFFSALLAWPFLASAQEAPGTNAIERLQARIDSGEASLTFEPSGQGYLQSLLEELGMDPHSQLLVFSAGSLQFMHINQETPRAIYHDDDLSVAWVQGGDMLEIIATDVEGLAFYTLDANAPGPVFERRHNECVICHGFATRWAPGHMIGDSDTGPGGKVLNLTLDRIFNLTDQRTPFAERYGGWYVTGQTGDMAHRGNVTLDPERPTVLPSGGLNVLSLADHLDIAQYLAPTSDIVSLLVLEHKVGFVNLTMQINAQYRGLNNPALDPRLQATDRDIDESIEHLVRYMTFVNEMPLPSPVQGNAVYRQNFESQGHRDQLGRSLHELDLQRSVFRYPLSFMVYSEAFERLHPFAKKRVWRRLHDVLSGRDPSLVFESARHNGMEAIAIIADTHADRPAYWN